MKFLFVYGLHVNPVCFILHFQNILMHRRKRSAMISTISFFSVVEIFIHIY